MADKSYKDYKFSVEQVNLMSQLYDSGMTADDVIAGFKQIQDAGNPKTPKTPSPVNNRQNDDSSFNSPQSCHNLAQDSNMDGDSFIIKTPSSSKRGRPKKVDFNVTDEDRINFSPDVILLMETDLQEVLEKITTLMKSNKFKIKEICDASDGILNYSWLNKWLQKPSTFNKQKVAALYKWYTEEVQKNA